MLISNYYRGSTDRLSGFIYDTDKKIFKTYSLKSSDWVDEYQDKGCTWSKVKPGWKDPADIDYFFPTKSDVEMRLIRIKQLGFKKDTSMVLDFGLFKL